MWFHGDIYVSLDPRRLTGCLSCRSDAYIPVSLRERRPQAACPNIYLTLNLLQQHLLGLVFVRPELEAAAWGGRVCSSTSL